MENQSFGKKYAYIYIWQSLSILLGFAAIFIVTPFLSSNKILYGIYSICASLMVFFSYADMGFLSAARKYGAEYYIQSNLRDEIQTVGFVSFLMIITFTLLSIIIALLGIYPNILIPELINGSYEFYIARKLLIILSLSCFVFVFQRLLDLIYSIRVENYKLNRLLVYGNAIKILSVLYFFSNGKYMLVEYYTFMFIINLLVVIIGLCGIRQYGYTLKSYFLSIKFDINRFQQMWKISVVSLISMVVMIVYFELDQIVITQLLGLEVVAVYAIAKNVMNIVRSYSSLLYSPYLSRYNHFVGKGDYLALMEFMKKMITVFTPLCIFPLLVFSLLMEPFITSWVGPEYENSALLASIMILSFIPNFIKEPVGNYLYAVERNRDNVKLQILIPIIYWIGIFITYKYWGVLSFAIFKTISPFVVSIFNLILIWKVFKTYNIQLTNIKKILLNVVIPVLFSVTLCSLVHPFMLTDKSVKNLAINLFIIILCALFSLLISVVFNYELRIYIKELSNKMFKSNR